MTRSFESLSEEQVVALAVYIERANAERFRAFADTFRGYDDDVAGRFEALAKEEEEHEALLIRRFEERFGDAVPEIEERDVEGVIESPELQDAEHLIFDTLNEKRVYEVALAAEKQAQTFYRRAAASAADPKMASLYRELAEMEEEHTGWVEEKLRTLKGSGGDA